MTDDTKHTARALAALGHEHRLALYRLLVRAGPDGLPVGELVRHLGVAPSTLAHHLATLVDAGLVTQERRGRQILSSADFDQMRRTVAFLTEECCTGVQILDGDDAAA